MTVRFGRGLSTPPPLEGGGWGEGFNRHKLSRLRPPPPPPPPPQVRILGPGPAVLLLSPLLHRCGIESIVLEARSRDYVENRIRAGVLEHVVEQLLIESGVGAHMQANG